MSTLGGKGTLHRAVQVLAELVDSERDTLGVRELAAALDLPPSSTHRVLNLLASEGLVTRDGAGSYSLGLPFLRMAWKASARFSVRDVAEPVLRDLVAEVEETALLSVYDRTRRMRMFVVMVEAKHPLRYFITLNEWLPVHVGATGLAISSFLSDQERAALLKGPLPASTPRSLTRPADLENEFKSVRQRGYALSHGQRLPGAVSVAAPVWAADGQVLGSVSLTIPEQRFDPASERFLADRVRQAAANVSVGMGWGPPEEGRAADPT